MNMCRLCGLEKEFYPSQPSYCKDCMKARSTAWEKANPERRRLSKQRFQSTPEARMKRKAHHLKKSYGLDRISFENMLSNQGFLCLLCSQVLSKYPDSTTHIDHDHITGRVRGILCRSCNQGIGFLKHDPGILIKAIEYLKDSK